MTWLSVIIPTYNGKKYLAAALESIRSQGRLDDIECIIIDDGSDDDTLAVARQFGEVIPLVFIEKKPNKSWVSSTNLGLAQARGKFSCFLHQDDLWLPGRLEHLRRLSDQYPELDCFLTAAQFIDSQGRRLCSWAPPLDALPAIMSPQSMLERLLVQDFLAIPAPMFRTAHALRLGGLDDNLWYTADWDFWLKIVAGCRVGYFSGETVAFRIHGQSQTVLRSKGVAQFRQQMEIVLERHRGNFSVGDHVAAAANFSIDVNVALAAALHGQTAGLLRLAIPVIRMEWRMLQAYLAYSCIGQRLFARIRALVRLGELGK